MGTSITAFGLHPHHSYSSSYPLTNIDIGISGLSAAGWMIRVASQPSPDVSFPPPSLADLSRNASVISSSSSSDSTSSLVLNTPRPRPIRTFSSPRARSPQAASRNTSRPPAYLTGGLGLRDDNSNDADAKLAAARARSQSRNRSVNGRLSAQDFEFGEELGEGSYSTVSHYVSHLRNRG